MPASKKPRLEPPSATQAEAPVDPALPDRRAMESNLATVAGGRRDDAIARAQNVIYDAWDRKTSRSRVALARKALGISPLCADAYNLLAAESATTAEARDLYARGLEAGELALGPEGFEEYDARFWGCLKTRPYMRARHGLSLALLKLGEEEAAMEHFRAMLKLNPGDNQGIRYLLLGSLLRRDDIPALETLLADYADEWSAYWALYPRAGRLPRGPGVSARDTEIADERKIRERARSRHSRRREAAHALQNRLRDSRGRRRSGRIRARMRRRMAENARSGRMAHNCDRRRQPNRARGQQSCPLIALGVGYLTNRGATP
jgi:tetratricopeptide (TPR) repeat protein